MSECLLQSPRQTYPYTLSICTVQLLSSMVQLPLIAIYFSCTLEVFLRQHQYPLSMLDMNLIYGHPSSSGPMLDFYRIYGHSKNYSSSLTMLDWNLIYGHPSSSGPILDCYLSMAIAKTMNSSSLTMLDWNLIYGHPSSSGPMLD